MQSVCKCMLTTLPVGNSVSSLCLRHVHIISEDVKERGDISLLQHGSIQVFNFLQGSHFKYLASVDCIWTVSLNSNQADLLQQKSLEMTVNIAQ